MGLAQLMGQSDSPFEHGQRPVRPAQFFPVVTPDVSIPHRRAGLEARG